MVDAVEATPSPGSSPEDAWTVEVVPNSLSQSKVRLTLSTVVRTRVDGFGDGHVEAVVMDTEDNSARMSQSTAKRKRAKRDGSIVEGGHRPSNVEEASLRNSDERGQIVQPLFVDDENSSAGLDYDATGLTCSELQNEDESNKAPITPPRAEKKIVPVRTGLTCSEENLDGGTSAAVINESKAAQTPSVPDHTVTNSDNDRYHANPLNHDDMIDLSNLMETPAAAEVLVALKTTAEDDPVLQQETIPEPELIDGTRRVVTEKCDSFASPLVGFTRKVSHPRRIGLEDKAPMWPQERKLRKRPREKRIGGVDAKTEREDSAKRKRAEERGLPAKVGNPRATADASALAVAEMDRIGRDRKLKRNSLKGKTGGSSGRREGLFGGMAFATTVNENGRSRDRVQRKVAEVVLPRGGLILNTLDELVRALEESAVVETCTQIVLIAERPTRTEKYFHALAAGAPILTLKWLTESARENSIISPER